MTDTDADCPCVFPTEGYDDPPEEFPEQCMRVGGEGYACTRPPGHDGQHVACSPVGDHRLDVWDQRVVRQR